MNKILFIISTDTQAIGAVTGFEAFNTAVQQLGAGWRPLALSDFSAAVFEGVDGFTQVKQAGQTMSPSQFAQAAQSGAPICPTHNQPMVRSKKFNGWFCPRKVSENAYCTNVVKD